MSIYVYKHIGAYVCYYIYASMYVHVCTCDMLYVWECSYIVCVSVCTLKVSQRMWHKRVSTSFYDHGDITDLSDILSSYLNVHIVITPEVGDFTPIEVLRAKLSGLLQIGYFQADMSFMGIISMPRRSIPKHTDLLTITGLGLFPTGNTKIFVFNKTYGPN